MSVYALKSYLLVTLVRFPGFMTGMLGTSDTCFPVICIASFIIIFPDVLPTILLTSPKQWNTGLSSHGREMRGIIMDVEIPVKTCFYWKRLVVQEGVPRFMETIKKKKKSKHTGKQMHFFFPPVSWAPHMQRKEIFHLQLNKNLYFTISYKVWTNHQSFKCVPRINI